MWDKLCEVLTDFDFLQAKIGALDGALQSPPPATVFELLRDFQKAIAALPDGHPMREQVSALYRAVDWNSHSLRDDPTVLVQQVYNLMAWDWDETTAMGRKVRDAALCYARTWLKQLNRPAFTVDPALLRTLTGHSDSVRSVAFSADGRMVASGSNDRTVKLWDAESGELLAWLPCADTVMALWFSPDSRELRVADEGGAAYRPNVYVLEIVRR